MSFHVFSMVFLLISSLGGVTEVEKAPWILVSRLFGKFRGPVAIIPFTSSPADPWGRNFHSPQYRPLPPPSLWNFSGAVLKLDLGLWWGLGASCAACSSPRVEQLLRVWSSCRGWIRAIHASISSSSSSPTLILFLILIFLSHFPVPLFLVLIFSWKILSYSLISPSLTLLFMPGPLLLLLLQLATDHAFFPTLHEWRFRRGPTPHLPFCAKLSCKIWNKHTRSDLINALIVKTTCWQLEQEISITFSKLWKQSQLTEMPPVGPTTPFILIHGNLKVISI